MADDEQEQQEHYDTNMNAYPRARVAQHYSQPLSSSSLRPPEISEARISQPPMNLARDDPSDGITVDTASNSKATTDSVLSFESMRDIHEFIREFNGRRYNAQNTTYFLPADQIEYGRLDKQHIRHCICLGGELCPRPEMVDFVLRPEPGVEKKVLDVGCGSGIWTTAMAHKYPHVEVIGTDLAPGIMNENDVSDNCRFELDDVNRGLAHFYDQMDVVHMRSVGAGLSSYPETIRELVRCLKPGGMLILGEGDVEWHNEDQVTLSMPADPNCPDATQPGKSWMTQKAYEVLKAQTARGGDVVQGLQLIDHGLWDHPAMDPDSCGVIGTFAPIGPWPQSANVEEHQRLGMLGTLERQNMRDFRGGGTNMLIDRGVEERVINHWDHRIELELQYCGIVSLWVRARYAWGRRLLGDGTAAAHIPVKGLEYQPIAPQLGGERAPCDPFGPYGKYPLVHYYPTAERAGEWMEWKKLERERLGVDRRPEPVPWLWP